MKRQRKTSAGVEIIVLVVALLCMPLLVHAGSLEPSGPPTAGTMKTLQEVYDKLEVIDGKLGGGSTTTTISGSTCTDAPVEKTGQTTSYATGDDGALQKGVALPSPRFTDNGNGTVKDNLTGLIWLKNANPCGTKTWADAIAYCNSLASGTAGLTDGSVAGAWRLPNVKELQSLIDFGRYNLALPSGHPFTGVQSFFYWSGTSHADYADYAWIVDVSSGYVDFGVKSSYSTYVWPVRSGN